MSRPCVTRGCVHTLPGERFPGHRATSVTFGGHVTLEGVTAEGGGCPQRARVAGAGMQGARRVLSLLCRGRISRPEELFTYNSGKFLLMVARKFWLMICY